MLAVGPAWVLALCLPLVYAPTQVTQPLSVHFLLCEMELMSVLLPLAPAQHLES